MFGFILFGFILSFLSKKILLLFGKLAEKSQTQLDDLIIEALIPPSKHAGRLFGIYLAIKVLPTTGKVIVAKNILLTSMQVGFILLSAWTTLRILNTISDHLEKIFAKTETKLDEQLLPIAKNSIKSFIFLLTGLGLLQTFGFSISSVLAGLGIGGMALALAAKDTLSNFFGSILIFVDKPFLIGDWVRIGNNEGVVEQVGLRTTRVRTFANSLVVLPNSLMSTEAIENYSKMKKRRLSMKLGLTYGTSTQQIKNIVEEIRDHIKSNQNIDQETVLVYFTEFSDSCLNIFVYCFTRATGWQDFLEAQQNLNFKVSDIIEKNGSSFAFPTQTLHIESSVSNESRVAA